LYEARLLTLVDFSMVLRKLSAALISKAFA
jgi:hypothetical protein